MAVPVVAEVPYSLFGSETSNVPKLQEAPWEELARMLTSHRRRNKKKGSPCWSPAVYGSQRTRANINVEEVSCLVFDLDNSEPPYPWEGWNNLEFLVYSTWSHTEEHPKLRVVLPLQRPVKGKDWSRFYEAVSEYLCIGAGQDASCKDCSRLYYLPAYPAGVTPFTLRRTGRWFDPDFILSRLQAEEDPEEARIARSQPKPRTEAVSPADPSIQGAIYRQALDRIHTEGRNNACLYLCTQLRDNDFTKEQSEQIVTQFFDDCPSLPGKDEFTLREAFKVLESAFSRPPRDPWRKSRPIQLGGKSSERAEEILNDLIPLIRRVKLKPELLFSPEVLETILELRRVDPFSYTRFLAIAGSQRSEIITALAAMESTRQRRSDGLPGRLVSETLPSPLDEEMEVPEPFEVRNECVGMYVHRQSGTQWKELFLGPVQIIGRAYDRSGKIRLGLAWRQPSLSWKCRLVDRAQAMTSAGLNELAGFGFPVRDKEKTDAADFIAQTERTNLNRLPVMLTSSHLGWQDPPGEEVEFLLPLESIQSGLRNPNGDWDLLDKDTWRNRSCTLYYPSDSGQEQIGKTIYERGSWEQWVEAFKLALPYPRIELMIWASLSTVLLEVLGCPNFGIDLANSTTTGKTTTLRLAASVWGCPDEREHTSFMNTWDVTTTWVERTCATIPHLPLILDDSAKAPKKDQNFSRIVYGLVSGRGRGRGTIEGTQETTTWRGILLSCGEQPLVSFSPDGGVKTRILQLTGVPLHAKNRKASDLAREISFLVCNNFGFAGPRFVAWVQSHMDEWDEWRKEFREYSRNYARRTKIPEASRMSDYAALISYTRKLATRALELPQSDDDPMAELWAGCVQFADDVSGGWRCLDHVFSYYQRNGHLFQDPDRYQPEEPHQGWSGAVNGNYIGFFRDKLERVIWDAGYSPDAIYTSWREKGILIPQKDGTRGTTRVVNIGGKSLRLVCLDREMIEKSMQEDVDPVTGSAIG